MSAKQEGARRSHWGLASFRQGVLEVHPNFRISNARTAFLIAEIGFVPSFALLLSWRPMAHLAVQPLLPARAASLPIHVRDAQSEFSRRNEMCRSSISW